MIKLIKLQYGNYIIIIMKIMKVYPHYYKFIIVVYNCHNTETDTNIINIIEHSESDTYIYSYMIVTDAVLYSFIMYH